MKPQILFVDDEPLVLEALQRALRRYHDQWEMTYCYRPESAWEELLQATYDAVVTDINMPGINGFDLLARMQATEQTKDVPVVVLTGRNEYGLAQQALRLGAVDLLNKPVDVDRLVARLDSVLRSKSHQDDLKAYTKLLEDRLRQQSLNLFHARLNLICRLGNAAEYRDEQTGNHVVRVGSYSRAIAQQLGMPRRFVERIQLTSPLHDIGKIGIPDKILLKPGPLTPGEWAVMQRHCVIGERILRAESKLASSLWGGAVHADDLLVGEDPILEMAATIALAHHEKWDGSGYPLGLAGKQIPLEARIVAICDVFDALTNPRPYKAAMPEAEALRIIDAEAGRHFAPDVYQAFHAALPEILAIRARLADGVWPGAAAEREFDE
jgi:putative two-component system response regulator